MMSEAMGDKIMQEDLEQIVSGSSLVDTFRGRAVFVTGATGLIGSQLVKTLACANRLKHTGIKIVAFLRSMEKAKEVFGELLERSDFTAVTGDINAPISYDGEIDYIVHGASATSSRYFVTNPTETIFTAIDGTRHALDFAAEKKVKGMVYLSSLEVYGVPTKQDGLISEREYGYIDPLSVRSSYSEGKRMAECLCASYAAEYDVPVKIARLSQTFGAGVSYHDGRVFAEFARCAVEQRDIVLHTQGNTVRSYCYTKDAVSAILTVLGKGEAGEAYNVTNKATAVSIREMAELVCRTVGQSKIKVRIEIPEDVASFGYNPEMVIRLDSSRLEALGWRATVGLEQMYQRMAESSFNHHSRNQMG